MSGEYTEVRRYFVPIRASRRPPSRKAIGAPSVGI